MILSASGGLVYHARAAFSAWTTTRLGVSKIVEDWLKNVDRVILFGPSGGYLLQRDLFAKRQLVVVEPDRIAQFIFRWRFPAAQTSWHARSDLLPWTSETPNDFSDFIRRHKTDQQRLGVLFLGVLGQIDHHSSEFRRSKREGATLLLEQFKELNVAWASLHDLESTRLTPSRNSSRNSMILLQALKGLHNAPQSRRIEQATEVILDSFPEATLRGLQWIDHETEWLGTPEVTIPWLLSARQLHILGWTTSPQKEDGT